MAGPHLRGALAWGARVRKTTVLETGWWASAAFVCGTFRCEGSDLKEMHHLILLYPTY